MPAWLIWLIVAAVLAAAESIGSDFVLVMCAGGAASGGIAAASGATGAVQCVVAAAAAGVLLLFLRPVARRHLTSGPFHVTGAQRLVGHEAVVLVEVGESTGLIQLDGAEWTARAAHPGRQFPVGTKVRVAQISGATALVFEESLTG